MDFYSCLSINLQLPFCILYQSENVHFQSTTSNSPIWWNSEFISLLPPTSHRCRLSRFVLYVLSFQIRIQFGQHIHTMHTAITYKNDDDWQFPNTSMINCAPCVNVNSFPFRWIFVFAPLSSNPPPRKFHFPWQPFLPSSFQRFPIHRLGFLPFWVSFTLLLCHLRAQQQQQKIVTTLKYAP